MSQYPQAVLKVLDYIDETLTVPENIDADTFHIELIDAIVEGMGHNCDQNTLNLLGSKLQRWSESLLKEGA